MIPARQLTVALALAVAIAAPALLSRPGAVAAWDTDAFDPVSETDLVGLTNRSRVANGLRPLGVDADLVALARWRSRDMVQRGFFSHAIPGGSTVFDEMSWRDYCFDLAGENIGWNTWADGEATQGIHAMFLDSPGHRRNIVGAGWDVMGVGAYKGPDGRKMWTVLFADACGAVTATTGIGTAERPTHGPTPAPSRAEPTGEIAASSRDPALMQRHAVLVATIGRIGQSVAFLIERLLGAGAGLVVAR
jgi:uncharacterized protein YkwD